jgi:succinyl-CoA synthetase beta subunit
MKLFEYEAKHILANQGIPVPRGRVAHTPHEVVDVVKILGSAVAIKAQVLVAGRGLGGGIRFADNGEEARTIADSLLGSCIHGLQVSSLLVEEKLRVAQELFLSVTVDRSARRYVLVASPMGGVRIEEMAEKAPQSIIRYHPRVLAGFHSYEAVEIARKIGYRGRKMVALATLIQQLYHVALEHDAELAEINPLVETEDGAFVAADARMIIDDNALYRQTAFRENAREDMRALTPREAEARRQGLAYVDLEGTIGVIGNGAGLVMATVDLIQLYGGTPANFLDLGGGASSNTMEAAMRIVTSKPDVKVVFINILGGITRCDEVARGIIAAVTEGNAKTPLVIRIVGTQEREAQQMLSEAGITVTGDMDEAAYKAVEWGRR